MKNFDWLITVTFAIILSVLVNYFVFTTDGEVWQRTAIQSIQRLGEVEKAHINYQKEVNKLLDDLQKIRAVSEVDSIMKKHGI
jgi:hypothetical protein